MSRSKHPGCRRLAPALALGALILSTGTSARADERTEARAHYKRGMAYIVDGRYASGIEELKKAYDILPRSTVLYNIARAYLDMGDLESSVGYYRKYLDGNPPDHDAVEQLVSTLEGRIRRREAELLEAAPPQAPRNAAAGAAPGASPVDSAGAPLPVSPATPPPEAPGSGSAGASGPSAGARAAAEVGQGALGEVNAPPGGVEPGHEGGLKTEEVFEETVVTASKGAQSPLDAPNSTSIITEQDIRLSGITKIPELLRRLAGVDIMETTGSQTEVSLRGFNQRLSNKVLVLVNGRSVYVDLLGSTLWGMLSIGVEDIERIEVVRGPGSALYGADAFNGVINIITKAPGEGGSGFNIGYGDRNTTHGTVWSSGRDKDLAWRISAGYDYLPRWSREAPDGRADLHLESSDQDASQRTERMDATVTRRLGQGASVGVQAGFASGKTEVLTVGPLNDMIIGPFQTTDVSAFLHANHVEVRAFWNSIRGDNQLNAAYLGQSLIPGHFDLNIVDAEAQYVDAFETGRGIDHELHVGVDYRLKTVGWTYQVENEVENHAGFFVHDEVKVGRRFAIVGDYRADYVPYLEDIVQSPRGSLLFHPSARSTLRATVGTAFRTPTFLESYVGVPVQLPVTGGALVSQAMAGNASDRLKPEQVFTTELGYLSSESDYFTVDSAVFYNRAKDLIELSPTHPVTLGEISAGRAIGPGDSTGFYPLFLGGFENQCQRYNVYGAELGARAYPVEGVDFYANTTLMDVQQDDRSCTAAQLALLVDDARTSAVKVNTGVELRSKLGVDGSIDFHYVSPENWAEQVQDVQQQAVVYHSFRLPAYTLLNASVGYRFLANRAEVRGMGFNLLDDKHREHPFGQVLDRRLMAFFSYRF